MTAKEARNQVLWNRIPRYYRNLIHQCVDRGDTAVLTDNKFLKPTTISYFNQLGYKIDFKEDNFIISW